MKLKLIAISLSLVCVQLTYAKRAPKDTFRLDDCSSSDFSNSCGSEENNKLDLETQDKITNLRSSNSRNFLIKKINQIRINRLEEKLEKAN